MEHNFFQSGADLIFRTYFSFYTSINLIQLALYFEVTALTYIQNKMEFYQKILKVETDLPSLEKWNTCVKLRSQVAQLCIQKRARFENFSSIMWWEICIWSTSKLKVDEK